MRAGPPAEAREEPLSPDAEAEPNRPLVLARAHRWQRMIDSGEVPGTEAIAARYGVNRTYIARMLQLTSLTPNTVPATRGGMSQALSP